MKAENPLFTTTEAAAYLGITRSYLYKLMMWRKVPYYKPRGKLPDRIKSFTPSCYCVFPKTCAKNSIATRTKTSFVGRAAAPMPQQKNSANNRNPDYADKLKGQLKMKKHYGIDQIKVPGAYG